MNLEIEVLAKWTMETAREVGQYQLNNFRKSNLKIYSKSSDIDFVTEVDKNSEKKIIKCIKEIHPEHSIIAEEGNGYTTNSKYSWVIDPLDGTNNYARGIPYFCISIALKSNDETIMGVVYAPYFNEMFYAIKGKGAYLNWKPIEVGKRVNLDKSIVCSGFPYDRKSNKNNNINHASNIISEVAGFRRLGASALDLAYTAAGFIDSFWEMNLREWDIAAGALIVKEAKGEIIPFTKDRNISIIAGNQTICNEIWKFIRKNDNTIITK